MVRFDGVYKHTEIISVNTTWKRCARDPESIRNETKFHIGAQYGLNAMAHLCLLSDSRSIVLHDSV